MKRLNREFAVTSAKSAKSSKVESVLDSTLAAFCQKENLTIVLVRGRDVTILGSTSSSTKTALVIEKSQIKESTTQIGLLGPGRDEIFGTLDEARIRARDFVAI